MKHAGWIVAAVIVTLAHTGCAYTYHAYPGKKLPNKQTALIRNATIGGAHIRGIDGQEIPWPHIFGQRLDAAYNVFGLRVLPGSHDLEVRTNGRTWGPGGSSGRRRTDHVRFNAEAGETYHVRWQITKDASYLWVEKGGVTHGKLLRFNRRKHGSGTVVAGEKLPEQ